MSYKPTKEEIALCKKIAKKHRKEIELDDKLYWKDKIVTVETIHTTSENLDIYTASFGYVISADDDFFFLWQISDCLEFLEEKGFNQAFIFFRFKSGDWRFTAENKYKKVMGEGKTRRAACLKVVLAIVEE